MATTLNHYRNDLFGGNSSQTNRRKIKHFSYGSHDKIGKGYSSIVYKGTNDLTNEIIAIKAIDMKGVRDAVSREMLDCQIEALTKIKHPNVLRCHDVIRQNSHCYIITEYCNEGDLSSFLKKKKKVSQKQVLKIIKDIISGFIQIGDRNYVHRDLKLANILIKEGKAIIADFGFAKKNINSSQRQKYNVGSPLYMSPQALKKNIYSVKNDIWSIGIMIYELLHGETPWECKTQKELIDKMIRIPVKFKEGLNLSEQIKSFIKKCLQVNETQRMSLSQLKQWNTNNTYESLESKGMIYLSSNLDNNKKPFSSKEQSNRPLTELTNRVSARSQSNIQMHKQSKDVSLSKQNTSINNANKQNKYQNKTNAVMPKPIIDKNNNIIILHINTFRLLFKIYQKLKKYSSNQKELLTTIGNDVINRVTNLMAIVCPNKENKKNPKGQEIGIIDHENYINDKVNPSIKKYKSVISEYYNKYTTEISLSPLGRTISSKSLIRETLVKGTIIKEGLSTEEMIMIYWMVEFNSLSKDVKKEYLDAVIQPKNIVFSRTYLLDRIKQL